MPNEFVEVMAKMKFELCQTLNQLMNAFFFCSYAWVLDQNIDN